MLFDPRDTSRNSRATGGYLRPVNLLYGGLFPSPLSIVALRDLRLAYERSMVNIGAASFPTAGPPRGSYRYRGVSKSVDVSLCAEFFRADVKYTVCSVFDSLTGENVSICFTRIPSRWAKSYSLLRFKIRILRKVQALLFSKADIKYAAVC